MDIRAKWALTSDPDEVYADIVTTKYQDDKCATSGALDFTTRVENHPDGTHTTIAHRVMSTGGVPDLLKKLLGETIEVTETNTWGPRRTDGSRDGRLTVEFVSQPLTMTGTTHLRPHHDGSEIELVARLTANIPVIGGRIERAGAPEVRQIIAAAERTSVEWDRRRHP